MDASLISSIVAATLVAGTPLIIVALGELIVERSGVLNLGAEGMMSVGAVAAFAAAYAGAGPWTAAAIGMLAGASLALIFGYLCLTMQANQVASGLALAIFGVGLSAFLGKSYESAPLNAVPVPNIPLLGDIPIIGPALFHHHWLVYASWLLVAATAWFLDRSRGGLVLRALGESPTAAHAIGYPVIAIRYLAVLYGGAMAGLGGAFLSVFYTPLWADGMVAGRGWIALALVVFATWRPLRILVGAYLFGGVLVSQLFVQGSGLALEIPSQWLSALPYVATIVVLVLISRNKTTIKLNSPASLGQSYRPES
ncbi:ABC transporter permease [Comamonas sp.]|uniref:ABC transporter permease n=1 Tax=Comamonas sp. TaxID=34028 RepID=UPI003A8D0B90